MIWKWLKSNRCFRKSLKRISFQIRANHLTKTEGWCLLQKISCSKESLIRKTSRFLTILKLKNVNLIRIFLHHKLHRQASTNQNSLKLKRIHLFTKLKKRWIRVLSSNKQKFRLPALYPKNNHVPGKVDKASSILKIQLVRQKG